MLTRRRFLHLSGATAASLVANSGFADVPGITLGVQLYMVRKQAATDLPGALRAIHGAGFPQVELFPVAYNRPVSELRRMVSDAGLTADAGHFDYDALESRVDYAHGLGLKYMVCPMIPRGQWSSLQGFRTAAEFFNRVGRTVRSAGMQLAFHNHDYEFRPIEDSNGFTELMRASDPDLLKLELDLYWLSQAGQDPLATMKMYANRLRIVHLKDRLPDSPVSYTMDPPQHFTELGRGAIDWRAVFRQARDQGVHYAFLDQDDTALPLGESLRISRKYLRKLSV